MGVIQRQGLSSSILMYVGMFLGFIISVLLFPKILGPEVYGYCQWMMFVVSILSVLSMFGLNTITVRFFPFFRNRDEQHGGYLAFLLLATGMGLTIVVSLIFLFREQIVALFNPEDQEAYVDRYFFLIPILLVITNLFTILYSYASALFRPRVPVFLSQVFSRMLTLTLIGLFFIAVIDQDQFIKLFAIKNGANVIGIFLFLYLIGELKLRWNPDFIKDPVWPEMKRYGLYAIFAQIGNEVVTKIDVLMVAPLLNIEMGGIYTTFVFVSMAIIMPHQGIATITSPLIAEAWKNNAVDQIRDLYKRTALNNFIVGVLIYIGILANLDNIVEVLGEKYLPGKQVAIFLGLAQLVHIANGYNGLIIIHSRRYRFDLVTKLLAIIVGAGSNYLFIQWYGLLGAALATAMTLVLVNLITQAFIIYHYRMHPFSWKTLLVLLIGAAGLAVGWFFPEQDTVWLDLVLRSLLITAVYGSATLLLRVSPDINRFLLGLWGKVKNWWSARSAE